MAVAQKVVFDVVVLVLSEVAVIISPLLLRLGVLKISDVANRAV